MVGAHKNCYLDLNHAAVDEAFWTQPLVLQQVADRQVDRQMAVNLAVGSVFLM
jgi:hypothetical protein